MEEAMIVTVQFTGNAKMYDYHVVGADSRACIEDVAGGGQGVCRVVIPGKVKEDGTLSLSIANVISHRMVSTEAEELKLMYPVVAAIHPRTLDYTKLGVLAIEAVRELRAQRAADEKAKASS